jgi:dethiobiotin synthetase
MPVLPPLFVTGTDTGVGKTHISNGLLRAARTRGLRPCGYKPVASGCDRDDQGRLRNEDALALMAASGCDEPYETINPYAFEPPWAPHLAAAAAGRSIDTPVLDTHADRLVSAYDWLLIEGAGGWLVPLDEQRSFADWVGARGWPVVLVVGMRLGCINHALLTAEAVRSRGSSLVGWIANALPPSQERLEENVHAIQARIGAPLLGYRPGCSYATEADFAALFLALEQVLGDYAKG